jgi:hypothetical protein
MTPDPTAQGETACNSDDSTADGVEGNQTGQHERQDNAGCATLPVALGASEDDFRDSEEECRGEQRSSGLREPKPTAEPSPIASQQRHARILGQTNELHVVPELGNVTRPLAESANRP